MASLLDLILQLQQQAGVPGMGGGVLGQIDPAWQQQVNPRQGYDRYAQGPTVASTGGAGVQPPWPSAPSAPLPPGMVPQMGLGEAAYTPPQQGGPQMFPQLGGFGVSPGSMVGLPQQTAPAPSMPPPRPVASQPSAPDETLPPNMTPTAGSRPPPGTYGQPRQQAEPYTPPPQQEPGFFDRLGAGFSNLLNNPSLPGLVQGAQGFATGRYTDPTSIAREYQMATYTNLRKAGYAHADAAMAANNPAVLKQLVEAAYQPTKFEKTSSGESGYLVGGGGLGGGTKIAQVTQGMSVAEKAAAEKTGQAIGEIRAKLPATLNSADLALKTVDELISHPGRQGWLAPTGKLGTLPPIPGTQGYNFVAKLEQAKGQVFRLAYETLKGGGAISEAEGTKAEKAFAALDRAQTPEALTQALKDLRETIQTGRETAIRISKGEIEPFATPQRAAPAAPVGGNWTQVTPKIRVRPMQ